MIDPESYNIRTQDLEPAYFDADRFYWGTPASWMTNERVLLETARAVIVSPDRVCVIDTEDDWLTAEALPEGELRKFRGTLRFPGIDSLLLIEVQLCFQFLWKCFQWIRKQRIVNHIHLDYFQFGKDSVFTLGGIFQAFQIKVFHQNTHIRAEFSESFQDCFFT